MIFLERERRCLLTLKRVSIEENGRTWKTPLNQSSGVERNLLTAVDWKEARVMMRTIAKKGRRKKERRKGKKEDRRPFKSKEAKGPS